MQSSQVLHTRGDLELTWTEDSLTEQIKNPRDSIRMKPKAKSNYMKFNRDKFKILFLLPKPNFLSMKQGTQKAKALIENTNKHILGF